MQNQREKKKQKQKTWDRCKRENTDMYRKKDPEQGEKRERNEYMWWMDVVMEWDREDRDDSVWWTCQGKEQKIFPAKPLQDNRDSHTNLKKKFKTQQTLQFVNISRKKKEGDAKLWKGHPHHHNYQH